jgi:hypothetical protein
VVAPFNKLQIVLRSLLFATLMMGCLEGWTEPGDEKSVGKRTREQDVSDFTKKLSSLNSASYYLVAADLEKFRPGRAKEDILKDLKWRGELYMAAEDDGKAVSAIVYDLLSDDPNIEAGVWIWAIFVDGKFVKFVKQPTSLPSDKEIIDDRGTLRSRPKPLKAADDRFLIRGMSAESVSIDDLKKEVKSLIPPQGHHIDPGLTAAYLTMRVLGLAPGPEPPPTEKDYLRNAALRDQFNAARLKIGMTESEVEATLKAKPLESGQVEAGLYRIYGSNESFDISSISGVWRHFSNILVVFRDGKAIAISSIPAGLDWRQKLGETTIDLRRAP